MVSINHMRRYAPRHKNAAVPEAPQQTFLVNSFIGAVDPAFDDLEHAEKEVVDRLKDRGTF